jgi:hypothetical protein
MMAFLRGLVHNAADFRKKKPLPQGGNGNGTGYVLPVLGLYKHNKSA